MASLLVLLIQRAFPVHFGGGGGGGVEKALQPSASLPLTWTAQAFGSLETRAGCNLFAGSSTATGSRSMALQTMRAACL